MESAVLFCVFLLVQDKSGKTKENLNSTEEVEMHSGLAERRLQVAMVFVGTGLVLAAVTAGVLLRGLFFAGKCICC